MNKLCLIFNTAPHYRSTIYEYIDSEYDCDWYFGKLPNSGIKEMDISKLGNVHFYKSYGNPQKLYWQGALIRCLFSRKYKSYLVTAETRSLSFWTFLILKLLFFPKKRIFGWSHGWYGRENKLLKIADKAMMKIMSGLFVYNQHAKSLMIDGGISGSKLHVIGNSLNYYHHIKIRQRLKSSDIFKCHFGNNDPVIIFIGRLTSVKRLDLLFNAVKLLRDRGRRCNIVLVGSGSEEASLLDLSTRLQIPVWFYGASYDEEENARLIYNADMCVSPGNIGLTSIHALTFGTPALTHDSFERQMPEYEAIIDGKTGTFFKINNVDSIANAIERWLSLNLSREDIRQACYEEIDRQWNPDYQMQTLKQYLNI